MSLQGYSASCDSHMNAHSGQYAQIVAKSGKYAFLDCFFRHDTNPSYVASN